MKFSKANAAPAWEKAISEKRVVRYADGMLVAYSCPQEAEWAIADVPGAALAR